MNLIILLWSAYFYHLVKKIIDFFIIFFSLWDFFYVGINYLFSKQFRLSSLVFVISFQINLAVVKEYILNNYDLIKIFETCFTEEAVSNLEYIACIVERNVYSFVVFRFHILQLGRMCQFCVQISYIITNI